MDSGSKRWSGNEVRDAWWVNSLRPFPVPEEGASQEQERPPQPGLKMGALGFALTGGLSLPQSTDEFSDLSFRIAELARDPKQLREKRGGAGEHRRGRGLCVHQHCRSRGGLESGKAAGAQLLLTAVPYPHPQAMLENWSRSTTLIAA